jgi:tetratricopeptide (TPR) repeat protein
MIVRDESDMLPNFLAHVQGLYDELCVVDTGSTDDTVALLRQAGAKVHEMPWQNDFSLARNACLQHATGDWVIWLDADELADPELCRSARQTLQDPGVGAASISVRNALANGHFAMTYLVRMFRRDASIRFAHAIHENVTDSLLPYLRDHGLSIAPLQGHVEHLGYVRERAESRDKKARDCTLLQAMVDADPSDLYSWYKLMEQARFWDDSQLLQECAPQALAAVQQADAAVLKQLHYAGELITLLTAGLYPEAHKPALSFLYPDAPEEAFNFLTSWESRVAPSASYFLRRAELHELIGGDHLMLAAQDFDRCLGLRLTTPNTQLAGVRPLLGLARVSLALNEPKDALRFLNLALGENPRDPEALLALATLSRAIGGEQATRSIAAAYVSTYGDQPELHGALGEAALRSGDSQVAVSELQLAVDASLVGESPYSNLLDEALLAAL